MKKKLWYAGMIVSMLVCILSGCSGNKEAAVKTEGAEEADSTALEDTSLTYVLDHGELILGFDNAFPPMGFTDDDQNNVGFDLDVAAEVANRMGVDLVLRPISWKAKEQELASKNIDCIWNGLSVTEDRKQNLTLSEPYMLNKQVMVTLIDSDISTLEDLAGKRVVIQNGSTAQDAIDANAEFKDSLGDLLLVEDNVQAMLDLKVGGSDAVVMDEVVAKYYINLDANAGQYKILDESLSDEEYAVAFRKGDNALCEEVNRILKEMASDGTLASISKAWFSEDITIIK